MGILQLAFETFMGESRVAEGSVALWAVFIEVQPDGAVTVAEHAGALFDPLVLRFWFEVRKSDKELIFWSQHSLELLR